MHGAVSYYFVCCSSTLAGCLCFCFRCACVRACVNGVRACVRACVRGCAEACVLACVLCVCTLRVRVSLQTSMSWLHSEFFFDFFLQTSMSWLHSEFALVHTEFLAICEVCARAHVFVSSLSLACSL